METFDPNKAVREFARKRYPNVPDHELGDLASDALTAALAAYPDLGVDARALAEVARRKLEEVRLRRLTERRRGHRLPRDPLQSTQPRELIPRARRRRPDTQTRVARIAVVDIVADPELCGAGRIAGRRVKNKQYAYAQVEVADMPNEEMREDAATIMRELLPVLNGLPTSPKRLRQVQEIRQRLCPVPSYARALNDQLARAKLELIGWKTRRATAAKQLEDGWLEAGKDPRDALAARAVLLAIVEHGQPLPAWLVDPATIRWALETISIGGGGGAGGHVKAETMERLLGDPGRLSKELEERAKRADKKARDHKDNQAAKQAARALRAIAGRVRMLSGMAELAGRRERRDDKPL